MAATPPPLQDQPAPRLWVAPRRRDRFRSLLPALRRLPMWLKLVGLAVGAALLDAVARAFAGSGPLVFLPVPGLVAGAMLVSSRRRWLALAAAAAAPVALRACVAGAGWRAAAALLACDGLAPLLAAALTRRLIRGMPRLHRARHLAAFVACGPFAAAVTLAVDAGGAAGGAVPLAVLRCWLPAALGMVAVAPLVVAWLVPPPGRRPAWGPGRAAETLAVVAAFAAVVWLVFLRPPPDSFDTVLLFPLVVWVPLRFGPRGGTTAGLALAAAALWSAGRGVGHLARTTAGIEPVLGAQLFAAVLLVGLLVLTAAIESRRIAGVALVRSQNRLRLGRFAVDHASDLVVFTRPSGAIVYANDTFRAMTGLLGSSGAGRAVWSFLSPGGDRAAWARHWQAVAGQGSATMEAQVLACEGAPVPVELRSTRLAFGGAEYCVTMGHDLREQRRAEQASRLARVGTLMAGVAHEINNPLAFVLGNLEWMADQLEPEVGDEQGPRLRAALAQAVRESREGAYRMRDIVRDLTLFARSSAAEPAGAADVARALRGAVTLARGALRHRARLVLEVGQVAPVAAQEGRLAQVFLNLLVNAAQAIPEGDPEGHTVRVAAGPAGPGEIQVEVQDSGVGMSPEVQARIFEPFFTTKPVGQGTGLGLSVCHGIISELGGRIEVSSRPGGGSLFRVVLPVAA